MHLRLPGWLSLRPLFRSHLRRNAFLHVQPSVGTHAMTGSKVCVTSDFTGQVQHHALRERGGHRPLCERCRPGGGRDLGRPGSIPSSEGGLTALVRQCWPTKGRESRRARTNAVQCLARDPQSFLAGKATCFARESSPLR